MAEWILRNNAKTGVSGMESRKKIFGRALVSTFWNCNVHWTQSTNAGEVAAVAINSFIRVLALFGVAFEPHVVSQNLGGQHSDLLGSCKSGFIVELNRVDISIVRE